MCQQDSPSFFMRFYGHPEDDVHALLAEFQQLFPLVKSFDVSAVTQSVNPFVPRNSFEGRVYFDSPEDRDQVKADEAGKSWYMANATKNLDPGAEFCDQSEKSQVYRNPIRL